MRVLRGLDLHGSRRVRTSRVSFGIPCRMKRLIDLVRSLRCGRDEVGNRVAQLAELRLIRRRSEVQVLLRLVFEFACHGFMGIHPFRCKKRYSLGTSGKAPRDRISTVFALNHRIDGSGTSRWRGFLVKKAHSRAFSVGHIMTE